jgi:hypothetical protein
MRLFDASKKLSRIFFVVFASINAGHAISCVWPSAVKAKNAQAVLIKTTRVQKMTHLLAFRDRR